MITLSRLLASKYLLPNHKKENILIICISIQYFQIWNQICGFVYPSLQSSAYLKCCSADVMEPEPAVCGKNITDFPGFDDLPPAQEEQLNEVL